MEVAAAVTPDWATTTIDLTCPMCDYNLFGLNHPRCPECGYSFIWSEILDARRRPHRFLFEHHPEANAWSYWKTAVASLWPSSFWRSLHPAMPSRPRRLFLYWMVGTILTAVGLAVLAVQWMMNLTANRLLHGGIGNWLGDDPNFGAVCEGLVILVLWPWLTLAVLCIFQASMRKARVKFTHVLRCAVYCFGGYLWVAILLLCIALLRWSGFQFAGPIYTYHADSILVWSYTAAVLAALAMGCWQLAVAYQRYLQFKHPLAVAVSSQVIVILLVLFILLNWQNPVGETFYEALVALVK